MSDLMNLTFVLSENLGIRIRAIAEAVSTPDDPDFGNHLDRTQLLELVRLPEQEYRLIVEWVESHGMEVVESSVTSPQLMFVRATADQVERAFGRELIGWLRKEPDYLGGRRMLLSLPRRIAGYVLKVGGTIGEQGQMGKLISGLAGLDAADESASNLASPMGMRTPGSATAKDESQALTTGFTPAEIREIYSFPDQWDGSGETIAMLMLGGDLDRTDLCRFWEAHRIRSPELYTVQVGPSAGHKPHPLHTLEATTSVEWAGAMAPGARIVVYFVDPTMMGDPWAAFLFAILTDDEFRPTIATTSWVTPERQYYHLHGYETISGLLEQAAALGVTVISAAGDWGPFDGVPRTIREGRYIADSPWPHGVFPAVEHGVLAVGGTMITSKNPFTEIAWSGPPPPALRKTVHLELLAGSGGFSRVVPIPQWQKPALRSYYPRGAHEPAIVPYGRGFPDVALVAAGPSVQRSPGEPLTMLGYQAVVKGQWIDYAGGTSLAAPIWAAIIARLNQARRQASLSRVGLANPLFYSIAALDPPPFREITAGASDVIMDAINFHGQTIPYHLSGFDCRPGWNPVCGLGVPHVRNLIDILLKAGKPRSCTSKTTEPD